MSQNEIQAELDDLCEQWDEFVAARDDDDEGMAGSPGEWMVERMEALENALARFEEAQ